MMRKAIFYILSCIFLHSCEDRIVLENTPENIFEVFWHTLDERYVNFGYRDVNWDDIYIQYAPRFKAVKSQTELKALFREIINIMEDTHVSVLYPTHPTKNLFNAIGYSPWKEYHTLFEIDLERYGFELRTDKFPYRIYQHTTKGYVYLSYRSFNGIFDKTNFLESLNERDYSEGLIIDVSLNNGGMGKHSDELTSLFFDNNGTWYYHMFREGPDHNSFSNPEKVTVKNYGNPPGWVPLTDVPLVLLTSFRTHSAGVIFSFLIGDNPNLISIGQATLKGGDSTKKVYLPNGWILTYANMKMLTKKKEHMTGGFIPDIETPYIHARDSIPVIMALEHLDSINKYPDVNYRMIPPSED